MKNSDNLRGYLSYAVSHTPEIGWHCEESESRRCQSQGCGDKIDQIKKRALLQKIAQGFRLSDLKQPEDAEQLIGTHLTEEEIRKFVGHEISFTRVRNQVKRCEDEELSDF